MILRYLPLILVIAMNGEWHPVTASTLQDFTSTRVLLFPVQGVNNLVGITDFHGDDVRSRRCHVSYFCHVGRSNLVLFIEIEVREEITCVSKAILLSQMSKLH